MLGGVVAANGRTALEHSMATLFALGDRGEIEISEKSRGILTHRDFHLTRRHGQHADRAVRAARARRGVRRHPRRGRYGVAVESSQRGWRAGLGRSAAEVKQALAAAGLLDAARLAIRKRYQAAGGVLIGVALVSLIPAIALANDFGPWPFFFPAAFLVVGVVALIFSATVTPLSNEGVRRGHRWRAYRGYLANVARGREAATGIAMPQVLPIAVALGLAGAWAKFIKKAAPRRASLVPGIAIGRRQRGVRHVRGVRWSDRGWRRRRGRRRRWRCGWRRVVRRRLDRDPWSVVRGPRSAIRGFA